MRRAVAGCSCSLRCGTLALLGAPSSRLRGDPGCRKMTQTTGEVPRLHLVSVSITNLFPSKLPELPSLARHVFLNETSPTFAHAFVEFLISPTKLQLSESFLFLAGCLMQPRQCQMAANRARRLPVSHDRLPCIDMEDQRKHSTPQLLSFSISFPVHTPASKKNQKKFQTH